MKPSPIDSSPKTVSESVATRRLSFRFPNTTLGTVWLEIASKDSTKKLLEIASKYSKDFVTTRVGLKIAVKDEPIFFGKVLKDFLKKGYGYNLISPKDWTRSLTKRPDLKLLEVSPKDCTQKSVTKRPDSRLLEVLPKDRIRFILTVQS